MLLQADLPCPRPTDEPRSGSRCGTGNEHRLSRRAQRTINRFQSPDPARGSEPGESLAGCFATNSRAAEPMTREKTREFHEPAGTRPCVSIR